MTSCIGSAESAPRKRRRMDDSARAARLCYGHLAGRLGVVLADIFCAQGLVAIGETACETTPEGEIFFARFGIDVKSLAPPGRAACRCCLDATERRPHIGGALGAALAKLMLERDWLRPVEGSRALEVTAAGRRHLREIVGPGVFPDEISGASSLAEPSPRS